MNDLTLQDFTELLNEPFTFQWDTGEQGSLELIEAAKAGKSEPPKGFKTPISLIFQGSPARFMPQQSIALSHDTLGTIELFLVPVAEKETGFHYEAIIS